MNLKFYTSVAKGLKRMFWGLNPTTFVEVTGGKLVGGGGGFWLPDPE